MTENAEQPTGFDVKVTRRNFVLGGLTTMAGLAACTPTGEQLVKATETLAKINTNTPTSTPENTPQPTTTPEATATEIPNPQSIATSLEVLGFDVEGRTFTYSKDNKYIIDQFNQTPKAIKQEDGTWRKLDYTNAEDQKIMYENRVPIIESKKTSILGMGKKIGDNSSEKFYPEFYISTDGEIIDDHKPAIDVNAITLGDFIWKEIRINDVPTKVFFSLIGLRDTNTNELKIALYGLDAPSIGHERWFQIEQLKPTDETVELMSPQKNITDAMKTQLVDGLCINFTVVKPNETVFQSPLSNNIDPKSPLANDENLSVMQMLFNADKANMMNIQEWEQTKKGIWPNNIRHIYSSYRMRVIGKVQNTSN